MSGFESEADSGAGVRRLVDFQQPLAVDTGINLRGRKRRVAEQFLDRAQIAAAAQQMSGKRMPQRMWRRTVGQAERAAQSLHGQLNDPRAERATARADEDGTSRGELMRAD